MTNFEYAARIYCRIFKLDEVDGEIYFNGVLNAIELLSEREQLALDAYYRQELPYSKVGEIIGVGGQMASNITQKAIRILRHPSRMRNMRVSAFLNGYNNQLNEKAKKIDDLNTLIEDILQEKVLSQKTLYLIENSMPRIELLDLSSRTYNSLIRAGRNKIEDVLAIDSHQRLMAIRGFGTASRDELIVKMREHGYVEWASRMEMAAKPSNAKSA